MTRKPTYEALEKRVAELEQIIKNYQHATENVPVEMQMHLLLAIINNTHNLVYVKGTDGRFILVNDSYCRIHNLRESAVIGKTPLDLFPEKIAGQYLENDRHIIQSKQPSTFHEQAELADGHHEYLAVKFPIFDNAGAVIAIGGISTDITDLVRAESILKESEEKMRSIFSAAPIGIGLVADRRILDVNQRFCEMTGYSRDELVGRNARMLYPSDEDYDYVGREKYRQIQQFGTGTVETRFRRKNGDIIHILMSSTPLDPSDLSAGVTFTALDITDRKQMEEALRQSEKRFRHLSEMLPEAIFETDSRMMLTYANRRAFELFGYTPGEISIMNGLELIAPEDRQRVQENMARRFAGDDPGTVEYRAVRKDGTVFPVLFHAGSVMNEGQLMGLRGIIIDLSAQKQAEAEKERIEDQYRQSQKVEALGRLAGGVAHDLNNLLTPIIGYAEMLMEDFSPQDDRKEFADQIVQAGYGARNLVRQLLAFGRKQTLEYKALNLNKVIEDFKKLLRRTIREDIELEIILSPDIGTIKADIGQIEQVVMNLCVNAQDAMPQSGRLTLETAMIDLDECYVSQHAGTRQGRHVMLAVSDTGCGMDQVTRDHIFEPFFSTKGDQGTGLGLSTVYGIVKQHGGNIWVYSEPQSGTVFKVYLPVADETDEGISQTEKKIDGLEGSETVLLVEDNDQVRRLAEAILTRRGYTLISAANGAQALAALSAHGNSVDLLLTDVVMPDMNGKELFEKTVQQCPDIKVLYMSGYSGNVIAHRGILDAGVQFIQKPFTVQGLAAKVREVLQND